MLRIGLALLALFGLAIPQAYAQSSAPLKPLRFGWQSSTPVITFWAGFELKSFEAQGLKVNLTSFNDNAPELEALVARQLDLAAIAPAPTLQGPRSARRSRSSPRSNMPSPTSPATHGMRSTCSHARIPASNR